jgi:hypothetical protein
MPIFGCALYWKFGAIYNAHPLVDPMWTVVPVIYNAFTAPHIQTSIFMWTYLRCYCRYLENATRDILQTWCQIQRTSSSLRHVNCGPEIYNAITVPHMQASKFNWMYLCCYWRYLDNSMCVILQTLSPTQRTSFSLRKVYCGTGHIQSIYSSAYLGFNIQL